MIWINYAYYILVLLSLLAAVYTRAFKRPLVFISALCFFSIAIQVFVEIKGAEFNSYAVFTSYQLLELLLLSGFYYFSLDNKSVKNIVLALAGMYSIWFVSYVIAGGLHKQSYVSFFYRAPIHIYLSLLWFYQVVKSPDDTALTRNPLFWVNAGLLIYFGLSLLAMGGFESLYKTNPTLADNMLHFTRLANFILYSMYIVAFICFHKRQKYK